MRPNREEKYTLKEGLTERTAKGAAPLLTLLEFHATLIAKTARSPVVCLEPSRLGPGVAIDIWHPDPTIRAGLLRSAGGRVF